MKQLFLLLVAASLMARPLSGPQKVKADPSPSRTVACFRFKVNVGEMFDPFFENAYLVVDPASKDALLIDPGAPDPQIDTCLTKEGVTLRAILNTHGHPDHTGGDAYYARKFKVKVYAHRLDRPLMLTDPSLVVFFAKRGSMAWGTIRVGVLHVPGHTPGSVAYLIQNRLFSGDILFRGGIGIAWGSTQAERDQCIHQEVDGITRKYLTLPPDTRVYPGHGEETTIGDEKRSNPCLQPGREPSGGSPPDARSPMAPSGQGGHS